MSFLSKATTARYTHTHEQFTQATTLTQTDRRMAAAVRFLQASLSHDPAPETIAAQVGLSASRFCSLFREQTGIPLGKYLKLLRLETARDLLETGYPTIQEVMGKVGIHDPSHFNRDFKEAYGVTPAKYRRQTSRSAEHLGTVSESLTARRTMAVGQ